MGAEDGKKELINHTASSGDLPNPGLKPASPALQAGSLPTAPSGKPSPPSGLYSNVNSSARPFLVTVFKFSASHIYSLSHLFAFIFPLFYLLILLISFLSLLGLL